MEFDNDEDFDLELTELPVLYLDIDGVLWCTDEGEIGPAVGLATFLYLALEFFDVRWCTAWAMTGHMSRESLERLDNMTGIPADAWALIQPSKPWRDHKFEAIDVLEHQQGRPFLWIEDELTPTELQWLDSHGWRDNYIYTDVFDNSVALLEACRKMIGWLLDTYDGFERDLSS